MNKRVNPYSNFNLNFDNYYMNKPLSDKVKEREGNWYIVAVVITIISLGIVFLMYPTGF